MTIQDIGSIGELLAAVATIATLVYLARQLRANTTAVEGESRRAHRAGASAVNLLIASDPSLAAVFNKGLRDFRALSPEEHTQFSLLMGEQIGAWMYEHEEYLSGILPKEKLEEVAISYITFLRSPGGRGWWATYREQFREDFRSYAEACISTSSAQ